MIEHEIKLTRRTIDAAAASDVRYDLWDTTLKGFGLRVETSGVKTYIVRYRFRGRECVYGFARSTELAPRRARAMAQNTLAGVELGLDPSEERRKGPEFLTVKALAVRFLDDHIKIKRKAMTEMRYRSLIERYLLPALGKRKAKDVRRADLAHLHLSMREQPYQANRLLAVIASMYSFGEKDGLIAEGSKPVGRIDRFPENRRVRRLSVDELGRLDAALRDPRDDKKFGAAAAALRLLLVTGAHLSEIANLRWDQVDLPRGLLLLPDAKTGTKTIALDASAVAVLDEQTRSGPFVFPGADPELPRTDLAKVWAAAVKTAKLDGLRVRDLRQTFRKQP